LYVIPILGVNYVRQGLMPVGTVPEWAVVLIVLAISTDLFVAITYALPHQLEESVGRGLLNNDQAV